MTEDLIIFQHSEILVVYVAKLFLKLLQFIDGFSSEICALIKQILKSTSNPNQKFGNFLDNLEKSRKIQLSFLVLSIVHKNKQKRDKFFTLLEELVYN